MEKYKIDSCREIFDKCPICKDYFYYYCKDCDLIFQFNVNGVHFKFNDKNIYFFEINNNIVSYGFPIKNFDTYQEVYDLFGKYCKNFIFE